MFTLSNTLFSFRYIQYVHGTLGAVEVVWRTNHLYYTEGHHYVLEVSADAPIVLPEDKGAERGGVDVSVGTTNNFNAAVNFSGNTNTDDAPRPAALVEVLEPWSANISKIIRHSAAASQSRSSASFELNAGSSQELRLMNAAPQPFASQYLRSAMWVSDHSFGHSGRGGRLCEVVFGSG